MFVNDLNKITFVDFNKKLASNDFCDLLIENNVVDNVKLLSAINNIGLKNSERKLNSVYVQMFRIAKGVINFFGTDHAKLSEAISAHQQAEKLHHICGKLISKIDLNSPLPNDYAHFLNLIFSDENPEASVVDNGYKACKYRTYKVLLKTIQEDLVKGEFFSALQSLQKLPRSLKRIFNELISLAHKKGREDASFVENLLKNDPEILLKITDNSGKSSLEQFIEIFENLENTSKDLALLTIYRKNADEAALAGLTDSATALLGDHAEFHLMALNEKRELIDTICADLARTQSRHLDLTLNSFFNKSKDLIVYDTSIDRMRQTFSDAILQKPLTVAMVGVEYSGLLKQGGLAEAIEGLTKSIAQNNKAILIFPKFSTLPKTIKMEKSDQFRGRDGNPLDVYKAIHDGIECYFIDHEAFQLDATNPNIYGPDEETNKKRFFAFSDVAADVLSQIKGIDVIHLHDWHVAGIALKINKEHRKEWEEGKVPPIVFTFHNNSRSAQGRTFGGAYNYDSVIKALQDAGISSKNTSLFSETLNAADAVTTVSEKFSQEAQLLELGEGISFAVRQAAKVGKLAGIINGTNTTRWNPGTDQNLKNWVDVETGEAVDLTYGHASVSVYQQKMAAKQQLVKWVRNYLPTGRTLDKKNHFQLDPSKPFVTYIGRFDSHQKGLNKLDEAIEATLANGSQFILMGSQEDKMAKKILDVLEAKYPSRVLFIRDFKDSNGKFHFQEGDGFRPGISSLVRAATDFVYVPSRYEPCGLVQFEGWLFGSQTIGANTGGIADTVISKTKDPLHFNGYLFNHQGSRKTSAYNIVQQALQDWTSTSLEERDLIEKRLMRDGSLYSWSTAPRGFSPAEKYRFVYEKAIQRVKLRAKSDLLHFDVQEHLFKTAIPFKRNIDAMTLKEEAYLQEYYFGTRDDVELNRLYTSLPVHLQAQLPFPYSERISFDHYEQFGSFYRDGATTFNVHAPNAKRVDVRFYDDNEDLDVEFALNKAENGLWTLTTDQCALGQKYHYRVNDQIKIDPYGLLHIQSKNPINSPYSVICDRSRFDWQDTAWMTIRDKKAGTAQPMSIYEVHPTLWKRQANGSPLNYRELAHHLVTHCQEAGFTHVELMGILEHISEGSMGYQVCGFFAPNSRLGTETDFKFLVDHLHQNNIGVILDWIPAHFSVDKFGLAEFDGTTQFETPYLTDLFSKRRRKYDWGTKFFDYRKREVREFLLSSAVYWLKEMHIDGLRVDAVMCMIESEDSASSHLFMKELNAVTHIHCKGTITIAEDLSGNTHTSKPIHLEGLGFDMKWNTAWMSETLRYFSTPLNRRAVKNKLLINAIEGDRFHKMVLALSHDEVKKGMKSLLNKCEGLSDEERYANLRALLSFMICVPGKKLNFMGNEFGTDTDFGSTLESKKAIFDSVETLQEKEKEIFQMMKALNAVYQQHATLWEKDNNGWDLNWIDRGDNGLGVVAYRREAVLNGSAKKAVCLHNFASSHSVEYFVSLKDLKPKAEKKDLKAKENALVLTQVKEIFNSDSLAFGGSGEQNATIKLIRSEGIPVGYQVTLPALASLIIEEEYIAEPRVTSLTDKMI